MTSIKVLKESLDMIEKDNRILDKLEKNFDVDSVSENTVTIQVQPEQTTQNAKETVINIKKLFPKDTLKISYYEKYVYVNL